MDRDWINLSRISTEYENGVEEFIKFAQRYEGRSCNTPGPPDHVRLLQPNAPQPLTLLRPFILGGLLPVGIEPPT